jgi:predicted deacylase
MGAPSFSICIVTTKASNICIYPESPLWPEMSDLAACLDAEAALLWDQGSDRAFEEGGFRTDAGEPSYGR